MPRAVPPAIASKLPAAAAVFAEHGVDDTSIKDVSELIGVPRATLYYYFAGKEDILAFLLQSLLDDIARPRGRRARIRRRSHPQTASRSRSTA